MKNYYRIMLGRKSAYAEDAYKGNFIGAGFIGDKDLTGHLPDNWRDFNKKFIPIFLEQNPGKAKKNCKYCVFKTLRDESGKLYCDGKED